MNEYIYTILICLNHLSEDHFYGIETLLDTLQGAQTPRIIKDHLQDIPEYGELSAVLREHLNYMVDWMIDKRYILQTRGMHPVLHPTYNGLHYSDVMTESQLIQMAKILQEIQ